MHTVSCCDDPFPCQHRASAVVPGALVQADLPGPAPRGHLRPPDYPHGAGAQPTLCKAAGSMCSAQVLLPDPHAGGRGKHGREGITRSQAEISGT